MNLELYKKFWYRIYHIQVEGIYSIYELEKLVKDIEQVKPECPSQKELTEILDKFYENNDSIQKRIQLTSHLRTIFHRPLKEVNQNPMTGIEAGKIAKTMIKNKKYV